ncbi:MAG: hypothetical protein HN521_15385 [Candidatus Latescibacteria bacterium]|nr:hypothetical protein [Candidatus Latescibacterota bacterium]
MNVQDKHILDGLKSLGIKPGDILFVHSSLRSFGNINGGTDTVIDALLETVGENGSVAMISIAWERCSPNRRA